MKFIILDDDGIELAVLFDELLNHKKVAEALQHRSGKPVSAGFCQITQGISAYGKSDSLGIGVRVGDALIISESVNRISAGNPLA